LFLNKYLENNPYLVRLKLEIEQIINDYIDEETRNTAHYNSRQISAIVHGRFSGLKKKGHEDYDEFITRSRDHIIELYQQFDKENKAKRKALLLTSILSLGVRMARPGEFSERAFLNDKLDLAQAEAIADLIESSSERAARSALRSLQGEFSKRVHQLVDALVKLRMYVESAIDFPEEEIDFLQNSQVKDQLTSVITQLKQTLSEARQGQLLREGMTVVIAGKPNAGKSTLLNQLTGRESAIVTEIPGTTRDVLREHIQLDGMPLHIIDTAGLREAADVVEREGIRRAWQEISQADQILYVVDASQHENIGQDPLLQQLQEAGPGITIVYNKVDLLEKNPSLTSDQFKQLSISAKTGVGVEELRDYLKSCVGFQTIGEGSFMARRRHLEALHAALNHTLQGQQQLDNYHAGELLAEELRQAQQQLAQITGEFSADDLLGKIFSSFCIGK